MQAGVSLSVYYNNVVLIDKKRYFSHCFGSVEVGGRPDNRMMS